MHWPRLTLFVAALASMAALACKPKGTVDPTIAEAPADAWAIHEALEQRIATAGANDAERAAALDKVRTAPDDQSAAYAYARASVAGRVAEGRGLKALALLEEMREWSETSIERDAAFMDMAATRMLGTLHVLAGQHIKGGDSERGLELLESVLDAHPEHAVNHLRVAQGYIVLGDPEPALELLCVAIAKRAELTAEEQKLLDGLIGDVGGEVSCEEASP